MMRLTVILIALALGACTQSPRADLGEAPPAAMPELPEAFAKRAERLPPLSDPTLGGVHRDGAETDRAYNRLAYRYNALLDAWECVRLALKERKPVEACQPRN